MMHRINGIPINLRTLKDNELAMLVRLADERIAAADDDKEKLMGEAVRRSHNTIPLFPTT